jgi:hypothetical protein
MVETTKIVVDIQLTDSYPAVMLNANGRTSGTPWTRILRPSDFWRDFQLQVISNGKVLSPYIYNGEPNYIWGESDLQGLAVGEYCTLVGATVRMEFLADAFAADAQIKVVPPEGEPVVVDFDLSSLR